MVEWSIGWIQSEMLLSHLTPKGRFRVHLCTHAGDGQLTQQ